MSGNSNENQVRVPSAADFRVLTGRVFYFVGLDYGQGQERHGLWRLGDWR